MGLVQKVLVLGCLPLGAWGVSRLLRPLGSRRAGLVAAVAYLGLPLGYDALARRSPRRTGHVRARPWVISALMRASAADPYAAGLDRHGRQPRIQLLGLGVLVAIGIAFAPAMAWSW